MAVPGTTVAFLKTALPAAIRCGSSGKTSMKEGNMTGTIGGVDNYSYLYRLLQAQGSNSAGGASLGKISANGKGSVNEDEQAAFESALTTQLQSAAGVS